MNRAAIEALTRAVLYEGYVLYPYRPSSLKNQRRWLLGGLCPERWAREGSDRAALQAEVLVEGAAPAVQVELRFLHLFELGGIQQALERRVALGLGSHTLSFSTDDVPAGADASELCARLSLTSTQIADGLFRVRCRVENATEADPWLPREQAMPRSLASAHLLFTTHGGSFVSHQDPPEQLRGQACVSEGVWPVLVGDAGSSDAMLAAPIILSDHPRVAPQSPGDLFDATEIDEILSLRILTLTDAEKREAAAADPRAREILERVERLSPEAWLQLHGTSRSGGGP